MAWFVEKQITPGLWELYAIRDTWREALAFVQQSGHWRVRPVRQQGES